MTYPNPLTVIGIAFLLIATVIIRVQLRANKCVRHTKVAEALAWVIVAVCLIAGASLLIVGLNRWEL